MRKSCFLQPPVTRCLFLLLYKYPLPPIRNTLSSCSVSSISGSSWRTWLKSADVDLEPYTFYFSASARQPLKFFCTFGFLSAIQVSNADPELPTKQPCPDRNWVLIFFQNLVADVIDALDVECPKYYIIPIVIQLICVANNNYCISCLC